MAVGILVRTLESHLPGEMAVERPVMSSTQADEATFWSIQRTGFKVVAQLALPVGGKHWPLAFDIEHVA
jgi:hypothetical protein